VRKLAGPRPPKSQARPHVPRPTRRNHDAGATARSSYDAQGGGRAAGSGNSRAPHDASSSYNSSSSSSSSNGNREADLRSLRHAVDARMNNSLPIWTQFRVDGRLTWMRGFVMWRVRVRALPLSYLQFMFLWNVELSSNLSCHTPPRGSLVDWKYSKN